LWVGGLGLMLVLTTLFSALPVLSRYGAKGVLGWGAGVAAITAYRALATPVMAYALSVVAWYTVMQFAKRSTDGVSKSKTGRVAEGDPALR